MKPNYSEPKIYTGGVDISRWSTLSKYEQKDALKKDWYVYFSFRNPKTGKLERQNNIKAGANIYKSKRDRLRYLKTLRQNLIILLEAGFDPYKDNTELKQSFLKPEIPPKDHRTISKPKQAVDQDSNDTWGTKIEKAFELALTIKTKTYKPSSLSSFKSNLNRFQQWLFNNGFADAQVNSVTKKTVIDYLNHVLQLTSARTRNNTRADLSALFQTLEDNDIIRENFVKKINVLKSQPKRNKTYNEEQLKKLYAYMEHNDSLLLLFVKFVSYNFLRPIEVCRLKIKDINLAEQLISVKAKNSPVKVKIIPEILLKDLPDLSQYNPESCLFTPNGLGDAWNISEKDKRNYFSKRFKKVKEHFSLGKDYGLYSFRHTFITKLYNEFNKTLTPFETKSKLMMITGHKTMDALDKYLRDIDAALPEDYSAFLKNS